MEYELLSHRPAGMFFRSRSRRSIFYFAEKFLQSVKCSGARIDRAGLAHEPPLQDGPDMMVRRARLWEIFQGGWLLQLAEAFPPLCSQCDSQWACMDRTCLKSTYAAAHALASQTGLLPCNKLPAACKESCDAVGNMNMQQHACRLPSWLLLSTRAAECSPDGLLCSPAKHDAALYQHGVRLPC